MRITYNGWFVLLSLWWQHIRFSRLLLLGGYVNFIVVIPPVSISYLTHRNTMFNMFSIICMVGCLCKYSFYISKKVMEFFWFSEIFTTFFMAFSFSPVTFHMFSQKNSLPEACLLPLTGWWLIQLNLVIVLPGSPELRQWNAIPLPKDTRKIIDILITEPCADFIDFHVCMG